MAKKIIRVVTQGTDGSLKVRDLDSVEDLMQTHEQIGIDDCSTDLSLRGYPLFRGLVGPIPEGKAIARYESPDVFEALTKEWSSAQPKKRTRRRSTSTQSATSTA